MNSYAKNGGAERRRFPAICEKPEGGVFKHPPGPARVKHVCLVSAYLPRSSPNIRILCSLICYATTSSGTMYLVSVG